MFGLEEELYDEIERLKAENRKLKLRLSAVSSSLYFTMVDVKDKLPTLENDGGVVIAFVPLQGFQSCKYHNGSKSWQSVITRQTVDVTHWLLRNDL